MQDLLHTPEKGYVTPDNKPRKPPTDRQHVRLLDISDLLHVLLEVLIY